MLKTIVLPIVGWSTGLFVLGVLLAGAAENAIQFTTGATLANTPAGTIDAVILRVVDQVPALGVLGFIVVFFLRHQRSEQSDNRAAKQQMLDRAHATMQAIAREAKETIHQISADARETARVCHETQQRASEATLRSTEAVERLEHAVERLIEKAG